MRELHTLLLEKQRDVERVREEIQALRVVIPLLADDQPYSYDVTHPQFLASARTVAESSDKGMADLETFYPFVRHMRKPEHE